MENYTHRHNPGESNFLLRFWNYVIRPGKVYFSPDDTSICSVCGCLVKVPDVYYSLRLKLSYTVVGAVLVLLCGSFLHQMRLLFIYGPVVIGAVFLYDRLASAFVLSFFNWTPYDKDKYNLGASCLAAKENNKKKWFFFVKGLFVGEFIHLLFF